MELNLVPNIKTKKLDDLKHGSFFILWDHLYVALYSPQAGRRVIMEADTQETTEVDADTRVVQVGLVSVSYYVM